MCPQMGLQMGTFEVGFATVLKGTNVIPSST